MSTRAIAPARRGSVLALLALAVMLSAVLAAPPATAAAKDPDALHVMSFNLRFASDTPPNSWPERRPVMAQLLRQERPELLGTQEGSTSSCATSRRTFRRHLPRLPAAG